MFLWLKGWSPTPLSRSTSRTHCAPGGKEPSASKHPYKWTNPCSATCGRDLSSAPVQLSTPFPWPAGCARHALKVLHCQRWERGVIQGVLNKSPLSLWYCLVSPPDPGPSLQGSLRDPLRVLGELALCVMDRNHLAVVFLRNHR